MKSLAELKVIRERMQSTVQMRGDDSANTRIVVALGTCGIASGARPVANKLFELVQEKGLEKVTVTQSGCVGLCQYEPVVEVYVPGKEKVTYIKMTADKAAKVIEEHIIGGNVVADYTLSAE